MHLLIWTAISWLIREVLVKFLVFVAVFALVGLLVPYAVSYLGSFIGVGSLNSAFQGLPSGVLYFMSVFRLDYGLPLLISATVSAFLIRRLPVIG